MKKLLFIISLALFTCSASAQDSILAITVGMPFDENTERYGLTNVDSEVRYFEKNGYITYLPGKWMPIPEAQEIPMPSFDCDSIVRKVLQDRIDRLYAQNDSLLGLKPDTVLVEVQHPAASSNGNNQETNSTAILIIIISAMLWFFMPVIYEITPSIRSSAT